MTVPEQHDEALSEEYEQRRAAYPDGLTLRQRIHANRRSLELCAFVLLLFGISIFWSSHTAQVAAAGQAKTQAQVVAAQQKAIEAACSFWQPLVSLPVTVMPPLTKPTKVGVQILAGARAGYAGQCHTPHWAPMPPPDPSLVKWARFYHIPLT